MEKRKSPSEKVKRILFLSADDFKRKSIQVIRKTPEAYVGAGWEVTYIVLRDSSNKGNYYYEQPIDLDGVQIIRKEIPGTQILNRISSSLLISIFVRMRRYMSIFFLIVYGIKFLKKYRFDVLYGYEQPGAVAAKVIKHFFNYGNPKLVLRFQGVVFVKEWLRNKTWHRKISNFDTFYALKGPSDLCIMTNDGSRGDWVLNEIGAKHKRVAFWTNGVDKFHLDKEKQQKIFDKFKKDNTFIIVSVSRIDDHKRVDRCIRFFNELNSLASNLSFHYYIVGEGTKKRESEELVKSLNLQHKIDFLGAVNQSEVPLYLTLGDAFISMYESSNVGNPLLEAIRLNKFILTLDNGGTSEWIRHKETGLIYPVDDIKDLSIDEYVNMAKEFLHFANKPDEINNLRSRLSLVAEEKLWTWDERFKAELDKVSSLCS